MDLPAVLSKSTDLDGVAGSGSRRSAQCYHRIALCQAKASPGPHSESRRYSGPPNPPVHSVPASSPCARPSQGKSEMACRGTARRAGTRARRFPAAPTASERVLAQSQCP
eukprot:scaffold8593_cov248-Pinguiococcus_pyrenoidosus.AAC.10